MPLTRLGKSTAVGIPVLLVLGLVCWKCLGSGPGPPPPPACQGLLARPLRVGIVPWPGYAGGIVANNGFRPNKGSIYYKQYSLCVEFLLIEDTDALARAFASGGESGVDIVWSTVDSWAKELPGLLRTGVRARVIMQVDWSRGGDAIVADKSIQRIEDLYHKRIALAKFTPSHWLLEYNLQHSRLDADQQSEIVTSLVGKNASPDALDDFVEGKVDAAVVWEPDVTEALRKRPGSHILFDTSTAQNLIADVMVAREDFISAHPEVIEAFVKGWVLEGTEKANRQPETVVKLLMENERLYMELGQQKTLENLRKVKWADLRDNTVMFNLDEKDSQPLFDRLFGQAAKSWINRGYITYEEKADLAKDASFIQKIYDEKPVERIPTSVPTPPPDIVSTMPLSVTPITVNFEFGKAELDEAAKRVVDEKIALLPQVLSGAYIRVEGNTDNAGDREANRALSKRRAQAVIDYLVTRHHLPANQFIAKGNGPDIPIASNATPEGRAKNRRTDVSVVPRGL